MAILRRAARSCRKETSLATYLLIWNPDRWSWEEAEILDDIARFEAIGSLEDFSWSLGTNYRKIEQGDRVFLMRLGSEPRGIFASGGVASQPYRNKSWDDDKAGQAWYVDVNLDTLLNPYDTGAILPRDELETISTEQRWSPPASGEKIGAKAAAGLEAVWRRYHAAS